ncbi:MAG: dipeptidase [Calditrichaeota bacterium]|nr:dipeptidase [Calditrichota bacterium]
MNRIRVIILSLFLILLACQKSVKDMNEQELTAYAQGIHDRIITLDTHNDIDTDNFTAEKNYTQDLETQVNLPKMEKGGLDVSWMIVYTGQGDRDEAGYAKAMENAIDKFNAIHRLCEEIAPDRIELALSSADVRRIIASGKKVAMIGVENAYPIGTDLSNIKKFADLGARYMSLSHNGHSQFSDSNTGERDDKWDFNGLSDLGKQAIPLMNKYGIMIDVSHPSKQAMKDMIELTKAPIIASHSAARALGKSSRNLDDEQLEWLKKNGGVVQTVAFRSYLDTTKNNAFRRASREIENRVAEEMGFKQINSFAEFRAMTPEQQTEYRKKRDEMREKAKPLIEKEVSVPDVSVSDLVDHIDYIVKKIGIDHVGISSDFDGGGGVKGWDDASETFNVTLELVKRGYTEEQIGMIWSGNLLRVLDKVQEVAKQLQSAETN